MVMGFEKGSEGWLRFAVAFAFVCFRVVLVRAWERLLWVEESCWFVGSVTARD